MTTATHTDKYLYKDLPLIDPVDIWVTYLRWVEFVSNEAPVFFVLLRLNTPQVYSIFKRYCFDNLTEISMTIEILGDRIKLTLSFHHRQILRYMAENSGTIEFRFNSPFIPPPNFRGPLPTEEEQRTLIKNADDSIRKMEEMGVIKITPLVGAGEGKAQLSLTDIGRNVIDQMGIVVGVVRGKS